MPFNKTPIRLLKLIHYPPQLAYALGLGSIIGKFILLLETRGRKTGRLRVTPLQYEINGSVVYVASARGVRADWVKNIQVYPQVNVRLGHHEFQARTEVITDVQKIAPFLELRMERHPKMVKAILKKEGLPFPYQQADLENYASHLALVAISPLEPQEFLTH